MHGAPERVEPSPDAVEIRTPARFHLGMFSFGDPSIRAFGGTGLMLDRPGVVVRLRKAARFEATGPHGDRAVAFARECSAAWDLPASAAWQIEVVSAPRAHVGLGSGTQLALAVAAGVRALSGLLPGAWARGGVRGVTLDESIRCAGGVGRGRRSSIGIHGFAAGGLIVEAGRLAAGKLGIDSGRAEDRSPLVARAVLPESWRGVLVIDRAAEGLHGEAERAAFRSLPPVDRGVTAELVRLSVMDLVPAANEGRFAEFATAFHAYGQLAGLPFEPASRQLPFHGEIGRLIGRFADLGVRGAAQSSWGPAVLGCCESAGEAERVAGELALLGVTRRHDVEIVRFDAEGASLRGSE
jgi:beta-RFAP synthase